MDDRPVTLTTYPFELLRFRRFGPVTPVVQMGILAALYVATTLIFARQVQPAGKIAGYPPDVWILFVPITEEILFRGLILGALEIAYGPARAVVLSSVFFGLWHLKKLYTTLIFGPVTAVLALKTRTIWPGAILHYLNNLPAALG
jgi:membrane protease YdiL (CAAX protease family)